MCYPELGEEGEFVRRRILPTGVSMEGRRDLPVEFAFCSIRFGHRVVLVYCGSLGVFCFFVANLASKQWLRYTTSQWIILLNKLLLLSSH
jgi:hypothetical protein